MTCPHGQSGIGSSVFARSAILSRPALRMLSYERLRRCGSHPPSQFRPRWLRHLVRIFAITFKFHIFAQTNRDLMVLDIIKNIAIVGAGSFIGGAARYLVSLMMKGAGKGFPWATFVVNLVGCFMIGLLWGLFSRTASEDNNWALFLSVGLCGGVTNSSTFPKEALIRLQSGNIWACAGYIGLSSRHGVALTATE